MTMHQRELAPMKYGVMYIRDRKIEMEIVSVEK